MIISRKENGNEFLSGFGKSLIPDHNPQSKISATLFLNAKSELPDWTGLIYSTLKSLSQQEERSVVFSSENKTNMFSLSASECKINNPNIIYNTILTRYILLTRKRLKKSKLNNSKEQK